MSGHAVVIAGGGPAGMMLAAELALADVPAVVVERRPDQGLVGSRAGGLHARAIELFDQRGIADRFLAEGQTHAAAPFGNTVLELGDLPTRHPYSLAIFQNEIERIMGAWVAELGVEVRYGCEVTAFSQADDGVDVRLADGERLEAQYLVGCDGGRSLVRKRAGIEFPGWEATKSNLIAEVETREEPPFGLHHDAAGVHAFQLKPDGRTVRMVITEHELRTGAEPSLDELSAALTAVFGTDFGVHSPTWISRFTDATRQAATYRAGRVLLAGDAAHVHYPAGGQGLNLAIQDAANLGWKLAQVVKGTSPEALLDTYHDERHAAGARTLRYTMALEVLQRRDERMETLVDLVSELAGMDGPRRRLAAIVTGLDVHYDLGGGHPLLGRRMPDLDLATAAGPRRVFELMHEARPLLLTLGPPGALEIGEWADRVRLVEAGYDGEWELPAIGAVSAPAAVLVRPDGYVAWVGEGTARGLRPALTSWFGTPTPGSASVSR